MDIRVPPYWRFLVAILGHQIGLPPACGPNEDQVAKLINLIMNTCLNLHHGEQAAIYQKFGIGDKLNPPIHFEADLQAALAKLGSEKSKDMLRAIIEPWRAIDIQINELTGNTAEQDLDNPLIFDIDLLKIPYATQNRLRANGVNTIGGFIRQYSAQSLRRIWGFSDKRINIIRQNLASYGLTLKGDPPIDTNAP